MATLAKYPADEGIECLDRNQSKKLTYVIFGVTLSN